MIHCGDVIAIDATGQWFMSKGVICVDPCVIGCGKVLWMITSRDRSPFVLGSVWHDSASTSWPLSTSDTESTAPLNPLSAASLSPIHAILRQTSALRSACHLCVIYLARNMCKVPDRCQTLMLSLTLIILCREKLTCVLRERKGKKYIK